MDFIKAQDKYYIKPLLSIVIPTRNRFEYVKSAIASILAINDQRIELVIQDNSDLDELKSWINDNIIDSRLKYNYFNTPLSFVGNFSEGVEASSGEYICIIGDDDGINPEIIDAVSWLKQENIDCLSVKNIVNYVWPDSGIPSTVFTKVTDGNLSLSYFNGNIVEANMSVQLESFVRNGCSNYLNFNLPKLYHGIVRRQCLEEIHKISGYYFTGLSPDISVSISLACVVNRVVVTDYPLTLPGICGVSASVIEGLLKKNSKKLEDAPHFRNRGSYYWSDLVPRIYCVETIWADSGIAALKQMGREDLIKKISLYKLAAYCIIANKGIINPVMTGFYKGLRILNKNPIISTIQLLLFLLILKSKLYFKFLTRVCNRILMIIGIKKVVRINGLKNIIEASNALSDLLNEKGFSFLQFTKINRELKK